MVIFGHFMLNESVTRKKILGIILSVAGVFIASVGDLTQNSSTTILGLVLVAVSVLTWAFYSVYSKKTGDGMDSFVLSEICFGAGFLCVLPFAVIEQIYTGFTLPGPDAIFSLLYLGVMSGGLGIVLWSYSLKKIDSTVAGIYFNLMPVIGLFLAFFAHERIAFLQIAGSIFILAGVLVCTKPDKPIVKTDK
jgi:drug/metabolite transporter (DMT)-like permease